MADGHQFPARARKTNSGISIPEKHLPLEIWKERIIGKIFQLADTSGMHKLMDSKEPNIRWPAIVEFIGPGMFEDCDYEPERLRVYLNTRGKAFKVEYG